MISANPETCHRNTKECTKQNKSIGFTAQNLLQAENNTIYKEYLNLVDETDLNNLKIRQNNLLPILVKAIQELIECNDRLEYIILNR